MMGGGGGGPAAGSTVRGPTDDEFIRKRAERLFLDDLTSKTTTMKSIAC
jgi:hypothetical protein